MIFSFLQPSPETESDIIFCVPFLNESLAPAEEFPDRCPTTEHGARYVVFPAASISPDTHESDTGARFQNLLLAAFERGRPWLRSGPHELRQRDNFNISPRRANRGSGHASLRAGGRAVDIRGNPQCVLFASLQMAGRPCGRANMSEPGRIQRLCGQSFRSERQ